MSELETSRSDNYQKLLGLLQGSHNRYQFRLGASMIIIWLGCLFISNSIIYFQLTRSPDSMLPFKCNQDQFTLASRALRRTTKTIGRDTHSLINRNSLQTNNKTDSSHQNRRKNTVIADKSTHLTDQNVQSDSIVWSQEGFTIIPIVGQMMATMILSLMSLNHSRRALALAGAVITLIGSCIGGLLYILPLPVRMFTLFTYCPSIMAMEAIPILLFGIMSEYQLQQKRALWWKVFCLTSAIAKSIALTFVALYADNLTEQSSQSALESTEPQWLILCCMIMSLLLLAFLSQAREAPRYLLEHSASQIVDLLVTINRINSQADDKDAITIDINEFQAINRFSIQKTVIDDGSSIARESMSIVEVATKDDYNQLNQEGQSVAAAKLFPLLPTALRMTVGSLMKESWEVKDYGFKQLFESGLDLLQIGFAKATGYDYALDSIDSENKLKYKLIKLFSHFHIYWIIHQYFQIDTKFQIIQYCCRFVCHLLDSRLQCYSTSLFIHSQSILQSRAGYGRQSGNLSEQQQEVRWRNYHQSLNTQSYTLITFILYITLIAFKFQHLTAMIIHAFKSHRKIKATLCCLVGIMCWLPSPLYSAILFLMIGALFVPVLQGSLLCKSHPRVRVARWGIFLAASTLGRFFPLGLCFLFIRKMDTNTVYLLGHQLLWAQLLLRFSGILIFLFGASIAVQFETYGEWPNHRAAAVAKKKP